MVKTIMMTGVSIIPLFIGGLRGWEWIIILVVVLLLFGGKKIPELMHGLGKGIRGFKDGLKDVSDEITRDESNSESAGGSEKK